MDNGTWNLRLYIAGQTPRSVAALKNLRRLCERHLPGKHHIELVDLVQAPHLAQENGILVIPTLVRLEPAPVRKVVGDLSNEEKAVAGLGLADLEG